MQGVRVSLSSGDVFWVDASVREVVERLKADVFPAELIPLGSRYVNPLQVAQLTFDRDIPSIHTPERLEELAHAD